jgi:tryptophan-rich sensory protein
MNDWYKQLEKPPLTPPDWIFGPVWTVLYIMIAVSILIWIRYTPRPRSTLIYLVLLVHLVSNFIWTPLFFGLQSPRLALVDIVVLDATLVTLIILFHKTSPLAAFLLVPYLLWVSFATYLNLMFAIQ